MVRFIGLFLCTLLFSSCVQLDELIEINKNGSARISITYSIPADSIQLLKDSDMVLAELNNEKYDAEAPPRLFDENKLNAHFKKIEGVEINSLRVNQKDGRLVTSINLQVNNFRKALRKGLLPYTSLQKERDGYLFSAVYPFNLSKVKENKSLTSALEQMSISFKVKTPTPIIETTGKKGDGNLVTWSFSPETTPFGKTDGKFTVKFESTDLTFLDEE